MRPDLSRHCLAGDIASLRKLATKQSQSAWNVLEVLNHRVQHRGHLRLQRIGRFTQSDVRSDFGCWPELPRLLLCWFLCFWPIGTHSIAAQPCAFSLSRYCRSRTCPGIRPKSTSQTE